ncbi:unnamed protein product [Closterium sp. Yama58-4]|nr:unnamed protein product [Closterium sp. Yama58-4]
MVVNLTAGLFVHSDTTIDGRGATVQINGPMAVYGSRNVIRHNVGIGNAKGNTDALHIRNSSCMWVDHCRVTNAYRGTFDVVKGSTNVTISNCFIRNFGFTMLLGAADNDTFDQQMRVTVYRNWFYGSGQRQPHGRWGKIHVANNLYTNWTYYCLGGRVHELTFESTQKAALYTTAIFMGWNNSAAVQPLVAVERTVYYREKAAGLYGALPYTFAQGLIEVPYVLVQTFLYCIITYALIQFEWTAAKFWWYFLFMFITLLCFVMYGLLAISITPNEQLAMLLSSFFVLCGFIVPRPVSARARCESDCWLWYTCACCLSAFDRVLLLRPP